MKMPGITLLEWQKRYGTEQACAKVLIKVRWPQGFQCPECGKAHAYFETMIRESGGKVKGYFFNFYFPKHQFARSAALALLTAS